jgi:hypothetical protein
VYPKSISVVIGPAFAKSCLSWVPPASNFAIIFLISSAFAKMSPALTLSFSYVITQFTYSFHAVLNCLNVLLLPTLKNLNCFQLIFSKWPVNFQLFRLLWWFLFYLLFSFIFDLLLLLFSGTLIHLCDFIIE